MLNGSTLDLAKTRRSFERKDNLFGSFLSWWREVIFAQSERLFFCLPFSFYKTTHSKHICFFCLGLITRRQKPTNF